MKRKIDGRKLEKYTPPGIKFIDEFKLCLIWWGTAIGYSISFLIKYMTARSELFEYSLKGRVLRKGAVITSFYDLMHEGLDSFDGFLMFYLVMIGVLVCHYIYYYQGSKSIYLMRRLPDKWEMHRRSITLPFVMITIGVLTQSALWMFYYGIYLTCTPAECLAHVILTNP